MDEPPFTALLLGRILARARETLNRSPEQVGAVVGVSGRTIRRLEEGEGGRPRRVTLDSLAGFYGLNAEFLVNLTNWYELTSDEARQPLLDWSRDAVGEALVEQLDDDLEELAMRAARAGNAQNQVSLPFGIGRSHLAAYLQHGAASAERDEALTLLADYIALDLTRRRLVRGVVSDLRRAQRAEREEATGVEDPG